MKAYFLLAFILGISACCAAQNNYITFRPAKKEGVTRIYIDRAGNVYPPVDYIDTTRYGRVSRKNRHYANIRDYFVKYDNVAFKQVMQDNGVEDFNDLQAKLLNDYAGTLNSALKPGIKLVVLIHGFNEYAARPFDSLEVEINRQLGAQNVAYLEVYWDGLKAYTERPADVFKIWFRANRTAPYAAMTLRKLFTGIKPGVDMYVITHSLGACVGTRFLFNTKEGRRFPLKRQWKALPTPTQSSVTLAMLAPAIAGARVFRCLDQTVSPGSVRNYKKIVVGYDRYDLATTKKMRFPLSRMFYSTSLGCNPAAVSRVGRVLLAISPGIKYRTTDFSRKADGTKNRIHHIDKYINSTADFHKFLGQVFEGQ